MIDKTNNQEVIAELKRVVDLQKNIATLEDKLMPEYNRIKSKFDEEKNKLNDKVLDKLKVFFVRETKKIAYPAELPKMLEITPPSTENMTLAFYDSDLIKKIYIAVFSAIALAVSALLWIVLMIVGVKSIIPFLLFAAACVFWFKMGRELQFSLDVYCDVSKRYNQKVKEWETEFEKIDIEAEERRFLNEFMKFDKQFLEHVKTCDDYFAQEQQKFADEVNLIGEKFDEEYKEKRKDCDALIKELSEVTLISQEHIHLAGNILNNLQTGRADDFKEALNIALDDERREKEEAARRAEAAARQAEMEAHNAAMERAAREEAEATARHNAAMERAAQDQARASEQQARAAEQQARAAEQQAKAATQQREDMARAARSRCSACANSLTCSFAAMNAAKATGYCAAFRPR